MQLSLNRERDPFQPVHDLQNEPTPYLSPLIWADNDSYMQLQQSMPALDIDPQESAPREENSPACSNCDQDSPPEAPKQEQSTQRQNHCKKVENLRTHIVLPSPGQSNIKSMISLIAENDELKGEELLLLGHDYYQDSRLLKQVFQILLNKFKKLKKTKEEMTKYCMRKAFKFVSDSKNGSKSPSLKKKASNRICFEDDNQQNAIELPFKKNSSEKTMNSQFLKQTFSRAEFAESYRQFLANIHGMIVEDNSYKIEFLTQTIEACVTAEDIKKIQSLKRLPWPRSILAKTQKLAHQLLEFAQQDCGLDYHSPEE